MTTNDVSTTPLNLSLPLRRRDGGAFEVWKKEGVLIYGRIQNDGRWSGCTWQENGLFWEYSGASKYDLLPAPRRIKGWIAISLNGNTSTLRESRAGAIESLCYKPIACIYIDVAEGEGLEDKK